MLFSRERLEVAPGALHVPGWLTLDEQRHLVAECRASGPVPIRHTRLPWGGVMSVQTVCIGWHWQPYTYTRTAGDVNSGRVADFPDWMVDLGRRALAAAYGVRADDYTPTPLSSTSTRARPNSACTRTRTNAPTRPWCH
ncbi:MAG: alkylated repair protein [Actinomycetia bacterium]|nr:alkylated repair protein [Actinomycetes bacterium]